MGGMVSTAAEALSAKMAEGQQKAMAAQREAQQNMMKRQIATQMAATRERLLWQATFYGFLVSAAAVATIKEKKPPVMMMGPLIFIPYIMAYQADMAWGSKMDRVKQEADRILSEEERWFTEKGTTKVYTSLWPEWIYKQ